MNCSTCGELREANTKECPKCGQAFSLDRKIQQIFVPGSYLKRTRGLHYLAISGFIPLGFVSLADNDLFSLMVRTGVIIIGFYLLSMTVGRIIGLRSATPSERIQACFDTLDTSIMAFVLATIEGFWWGFSETALKSYSDIPELHFQASAYASGVSTVCFLLGIFLTLVTLAEISHTGVGEFREKS